MEDIIKVRIVVLKAIENIFENAKFSNDEVLRLINEVDNMNKGLFRKLVYGVVENKLYLDYIIQKYSKLKINKLDKKILNILRIAVYELIFLNTKKYAVINEAVNNTKKYNFKSKGFVNAVLRNIDRNIEEAKKVDLKDKDKYLSIRYSTNIDIIKYLKKEFANYEEIVSLFTDTPSLNIRVNTFLIDKLELINLLKHRGLIVEESCISKDALIIKNPIEITELEEFKNGLFTIQDQASILVGNILNPKENSKVLDICAAPGSKSTHLLQIMNNKGKVVSNDISSDKLKKIDNNYKRLKLLNYDITNYDATKYIKEFENEFDYILVDAPCSGLGVINRKPEIKLNRTLEDIKSLSEIQSKILENSYKYLKDEGVIVYSTCTLGSLENENIINSFLNKYTDINIEKIDGNNNIKIMPNIGNDGFFICKMTKKSIV